MSLLVAAAVIYPGFTVTQVDLNDGDVWVTNASKNLVGLNYQSKLLDGGPRNIDNARIAAVGDNPVVLDPATGN